MGKRSPSQPAPPDPYQTADAQGQLNRESAAYNAAINRINTNTPWGSQTYGVTGTDPRTGAPLYEQNIELSPDQQALLDAQNKQSLQLSNLGGQVIGGLSGEPIDTSGLPQLQSGFNLGGPGQQYSYGTADPQMGIDRSNLTDLRDSYNVYDTQLNVDRSNLPSLPGEGDLTGFRDRAEGALYDRNTAYLDQRYGRDEDALRSRLANQGIVEGSEAYSNAIDDFERGREMSYRQARNESIIGGGAEAERMNRIGSSQRGQLYGEALTGGQFANKAAAQATGMDAQSAAFQNMARGQGFGEELGAGQFTNQAAGQFTGQNRDAAGFANQSRNQALSEALMGANLNNQSRAQGLEEMFALRNQPLNEYNAIRSMSQVNTPQFEGTARVGSAPADITGPIYQNYQGQLNNYNADVASRNALMQGLFGLGGAALFASDEDVKDNIVPIGELNDGTGLYSFTYKGDDTPQVGVMAQEVEKTLPDAVIKNDKGIRHVDYAKVLMQQVAA